jgi:hypothetical protein
MYLINLLVSLFDGDTQFTPVILLSFLYVTFVNKFKALFTMVNTEEFIKGSKLY